MLLGVVRTSQAPRYICYTVGPSVFRVVHVLRPRFCEFIGEVGVNVVKFDVRVRSGCAKEARDPALATAGRRSRTSLLF